MTDINNTEIHMDASEEKLIYLCPNFKILAIILYSSLSVVAFLGNFLIVWVILYFRRLRTPTNMLILNLAIADLMISIFCMPLSYWHVIIFQDHRWIFGGALCKLFNFLQAVAVFLSSWTLVAISFDRFLAIMFVMTPWLRLTKAKAFYMILVTWAFSIFMALPLFFANKITVAGDIETCGEDFKQLGFNEETTETFTHTYSLSLFGLQYCLPLLVLIITYAFIGIRMWNSKVPGERQSASIRGLIQERHESVKKLVPMVLLVSILYAGCWLPQNLLMNIWVVYYPSIQSHPYILHIWWMSHTLAMFHSTVNPFIYYYSNRRIKEGVMFVLRFLPWMHFRGFRFLADKKGTNAVRIGVYAGLAYIPNSGKKVLTSMTSVTSNY
uniref:G-protein coupled receptors family 1 profile domain-containing protein n=1 Tax=Acrobeloides nanus TaxID=290746 RepID=A0A914E952_9BILA